METPKEEALVMVIRAWFHDIQLMSEIKEMVACYREIVSVKESGRGRVEFIVDGGQIIEVRPSKNKKLEL